MNKPELKAGTVLVVKIRYTPEGDEYIDKGHILYAVSDAEYRTSADYPDVFYWCIDILDPTIGSIITWHRTNLQEMHDVIAYYHEIIGE